MDLYTVLTVHIPVRTGTASNGLKIHMVLLRVVRIIATEQRRCTTAIASGHGANSGRRSQCSEDNSRNTHCRINSLADGSRIFGIQDHAGFGGYCKRPIYACVGRRARVNKRLQGVEYCGQHTVFCEIDRARNLSLCACKIDMQIIAFNRNLYTDFYWVRRRHTRIIHIINKAVLAVLQVPNTGAQTALSIILKLMHAIDQQVSITRIGILKTAGTHTIGSDLSLKVTIALVWDPRIAENEVYNIRDGLAIAANTHQRDLEPLLKDTYSITAGGPRLPPISL